MRIYELSQSQRGKKPSPNRKCYKKEKKIARTTYPERSTSYHTLKAKIYTAGLGELQSCIRPTWAHYYHTTCPVWGSTPKCRAAATQWRRPTCGRKPRTGRSGCTAETRQSESGEGCCGPSIVNSTGRWIVQCRIYPLTSRRAMTECDFCTICTPESRRAGFLRHDMRCCICIKTRPGGRFIIASVSSSKAPVCQPLSLAQLARHHYGFQQQFAAGHGHHAPRPACSRQRSTVQSSPPS